MVFMDMEEYFNIPYHVFSLKNDQLVLRKGVLTRHVKIAINGNDPGHDIDFFTGNEAMIPYHTILFLISDLLSARRPAFPQTPSVARCAFPGEHQAG